MTDPGRRLEGREEIAAVLGEAANSARRQIRLFTRVLTARPFDDPLWLEALRRLGRRGARCQIQLLAREPGEDIHRAHGLVRVAQQLTSACEVRLAHPRDRERKERLLLVDDGGVLRQASEEAPRALYWTDDRANGRPLREDFDQLWGRAEPHPAFRRLMV